MGKFITRIQAALQGCIIETPHSDDIRAIVGDAQCPDSSPRPVIGWSDGIDCSQSTGWPVIRFSKPIYSTNGATGMSITSGAKTFNISNGDAGLGTTDLIYSGTWTSALVAGDVITATYDDTVGDYNDGDATDPQDTVSFNRTLINCLDIPATNLIAVVTGTSAINLTWTDPASTTGYDDYVLKRDGTVLTPAPAIGDESFPDSGLSANTTYRYTLQTRANGVDISGALSDSAKTDAASAVDAWATEDGFDWLTEDGFRWILE